MQSIFRPATRRKHVLEQHEPNHRYVNERLGGFRQTFVVRLEGSVAASSTSSGEIILTFVKFLHELDADEDAARVVELLEAEHRLNPSFDAPVILLDDVV